jgi:hypothetical protein
MADSTVFSSPPLGVERSGEAGAAAAMLDIEGVFFCDIRAFPTSPPQWGGEENQA